MPPPLSSTLPRRLAGSDVPLLCCALGVARELDRASPSSIRACSGGSPATSGQANSARRLPSFASLRRSGTLMGSPP